MNCPTYGKEYVVNSRPYSVDTTALTHVDWSIGQVFTTDDYTTRAASGAQYKCIVAHTAAANNEPGVGANFETYWRLIAEPWVKYIQPIDANNHQRWFSDGSTTPPTVTRDFAGTTGGDALLIDGTRVMTGNFDLGNGNAMLMRGPTGQLSGRWVVNGSNEPEFWTDPDGGGEKRLFRVTETDFYVSPDNQYGTTYMGPHAFSLAYTSGGAAMEISDLIVGARFAFQDFQAHDGGAHNDFSGRVLRAPGETGEFQIINIDGAIRIMATQGDSGAFQPVYLQSGPSAICAVTGSAFQPATDNAYTLGVSGVRWASVWAANGTIQTSDQRLKEEVENSAELLDQFAPQFVRQIDPHLFRWKEGGTEVCQKTDENGEPLFEEIKTGRFKAVKEKHTVLVPKVEVDEKGNAVLKQVEEERWTPVVDHHPLFDEDGEPVLDPKTGKQIIKAVPRMREEIERKPVMEEISKPGKRVHAGFFAQEIQSVLEKFGVDFGVWGLEDHKDPDSQQWTRPDQMIPVLWQALKSEMKRNDELEARIDALEKA